MKINLMPKKCLGWMTPFEVHWGEKLQLTWQCGKNLRELDIKGNIIEDFSPLDNFSYSVVSGY
jgi:hypothetical protein